jgi:hypothetical protein
VFSHVFLVGVERSLRTRITKSLNQVTPEAHVPSQKAAEIIQLFTEGNHGIDMALVKFHFVYALCENVRAKISSNNSLAFPYAQCGAYVAAHVPGTWNLLMESLQDRCPFLVPEQVQLESAEDYCRRNNLDARNFGKDVFGYGVLFAALCVVQIPCPSRSFRDLMRNIGELWTSMVTLANVQPTCYTPTLLSAFLQTASEDMFCVYGKQMQKMLRYLNDAYLPLCDEATRKGILASMEARSFSLLLGSAKERNYSGITLQTQCAGFPAVKHPLQTRSTEDQKGG